MAKDMELEYNKCLVFQRDRWHADHNFVNSVRAALMLHYNYRDGKIGEFEARI
jgi:hypothetical protein